MDHSAETISHDGEIMQMPVISTADQSLAVAMSRIEIDHQISTARAYPRSIDRAIKNITTLTTLDEETAESCIYALPRGNKPVQGPSIRLAEVVSGQWGNCRVGARVVHVDRVEKVVVAEGLFHDLETNVQTRAQVQRRIVDSKGRLYSDDMIIVTGNAACSIAKRNAILGGVPKGIWGGAYDRALKVVAGTVETLSVTREKAVGAFAHFGVKPEQVFGALALEGYEDITLNHIPTLRGMFSALKNGEATVEEMFSPRVVGNVHQAVNNPLADTGPAKAATPAKAAPAATTKPAAEPAPAGRTPDATIAELARRFGLAKSAAEVETAFSEVTVGDKLYKASGYMERARTLKDERLAALASKTKAQPAKPEVEDATIISETVTAGPSPAEAQAAEVGINPDDELANLIDKLAHAQDEATVEEWYAETDIEAALGEFTGYVEKARAIKAQQISRVQAIAERAAKAAEPVAPPPPASTGLADDEEAAAPPPPPAVEDKGFDLQGWRDIAAKQPYIDYADLLARHAKKVGDAKLIETFWADSKAKRTELITEADERLALLKRLNGVIDEINIANGRAAHGA